MIQTFQSLAGAGVWLMAKRDANLVCTSPNWTGETVTIEARMPGGEAFTLTDAAGSVALTANGGRFVRGGLEYRMNKAGTAEVTMSLLSGLAASEV